MPSHPVAASPEAVAERVASVRARIARAGGDPDRVVLVAVTKGFGDEVVRAALAAGLGDLGESYVQELVAKAAAVVPGEAPRWHAIGRLQRNKVRAAAAHVHLWHSVDRLPLAEEIARWAPGAAVLIQVNAAGEASKAGCAPAELPDLVAAARGLGLDVRGLMTMAPLTPADAARPVFRRVRRLADELGLPELSAGMSGDLDVAVAEGSTLVRVGSALFGPRPGRAGMRH